MTVLAPSGSLYCTEQLTSTAPCRSIISNPNTPLLKTQAKEDTLDLLERKEAAAQKARKRVLAGEGA